MKIWDNIVVLSNWLMWPSLVVSYLTYGTTDMGASIHIIANTTLFIGCFMRLVWGYVGSQTALFSDMLRPFPQLMVHLINLTRTQPSSFVGHSPVGGIVACLVFVSMIFTAMTGLFIVSQDGQVSVIGQFFNTLPLQGPHGLHAFFLNTGFMLAVPYAIGVLYGLFTSSSSLSGFLFGGEENAYVSVSEAGKMNDEDPITSSMALSVMTLCLAMILVIPAVSNIFTQQENREQEIQAREMARSNANPLENGRNMNLIDENGRVQDWGSILSTVQPAAGMPAAPTITNEPVVSPDATFSRVNTRQAYEENELQRQRREETEQLQQRSEQIIINLPIPTE